MSTTTSGHDDDSEAGTTKALREAFGDVTSGRPSARFWMVGAALVVVVLLGLVIWSRAGDGSFQVLGMLLTALGVAGIFFQIARATKHD